MVSSGTGNATKLAKVWPTRKRVPASTVAVCFAFCRSSLPANVFRCARIYARRISEATSVSRGVTRGGCDSHSLLVPLEPTRFSIGFQIKWKSRGSRLDLPLRQNGPRFHPAIRATPSLSLCPFFSSFSKYFLDREISVGFFHAIFEIFAKFEDSFAQLVQSRVNLKVWEK